MCKRTKNPYIGMYNLVGGKIEKENDGLNEAYRKKKEDLNEELADIAIYLMGLSEMLGYDLETEIKNKVNKNEKRVYKNIDGVNVRISD